MKHALIFSIFFFFSFLISAQEFQGVATYKSTKKIDFKADEAKLNDEMRNAIKMLKKQFQKTYKLNFNSTVSLFKENEKLKPIGMEGVSNLGETKIIYKNLKENRYTSQNETLSKFFLVQDELLKHNWTLTNEKKFIGDYECFKATKMIEAPILKARISANNFKGEDRETLNKPAEIRQQEVIAWYAIKIPISNGPAMYHGLPGLILELNDGVNTFVCSKIVLNPKKEVNVKEPKKGVKMNQKEYDKIIKDKMKQVEEQRNNSRRNNGDDVEIIIRKG